MKTVNDPDRLLEPLEAAHFLGITQELLFAYVRYPPKTSLGHTRRLVAEQNGGRTLFRFGELVTFDAYLKEPWSTDGQTRPPIPSYVIQHLKTECGGQCPRCGRGFRLENAHIDDYAHSLSHHHHNLIRLCVVCHEEFDTKRLLPAGEIARLKEKLIAQTRERLAQRFTAWPKTGLGPPTPASIFIGRDAELKVLVNALGQRRTVCIQGAGGIGKTQLALNALAQVSDEAKIVWVDVEAFESVADLELNLRSALVSVDGRQLAHSLPELLETEVDLLVFDGVEAITPARLEELEDFFSQLIARTRSTKFLFTSQVELLSVDVDLSIKLPPLSEAASTDVVQAIAGPLVRTSETGDANALAWLVAFSDGHPLTLKIIGGLLRYFKSARVVVERIEKSGAAALSNPTRQRQTKATSLDVCLTVAYSALQPEERRILFVVSHCPAGCLAAMFERKHYGMTDSQAAIAALGRWHLLSEELEASPGPRVRSLSPIRSFVQRLYQEEDPESANSLFLRLAQDLTLQAVVLDDRDTFGGDIGHGMVRLGQEFPNLSYVFDESVRRSKAEPAYLALIWTLASCLQVFCFLTGLSRRGIEIMGAGATAAIQSDKPRVASQLLMQLLALARRAGDHEEARQAVQGICDLAQGSTDSKLVGHAEMARGLLAKDEGRLDEAELCFIAACSHYERPRPNQEGPTAEKVEQDSGADEHMLAMSLMEQASIYEHTGRPAKALEIYSRSLSLIVKTKDDVNYGAILHQMANCHSALNQNESAYRAYVESATRFAQIGASVHLSNSLSELGYLLIDHAPAVSIQRALSSELLEAGLVDVLQECADVFRPELNPLPLQECLRLLRKLFGMAILVGFTPHNTLLEDFTDLLRERLVRPLAAQVRHGVRDTDKDGLPLMYLDVMGALIGSLAGAGQTEGDEVANLSEIGHLAHLCYQQYDWAWKTFRLFDWLATYLSRCRGVPGITAAMLQTAAEEAATKGQPFAIPGFALAPG